MGMDGRGSPKADVHRAMQGWEADKDGFQWVPKCPLPISGASSLPPGNKGNPEALIHPKDQALAFYRGPRQGLGARMPGLKSHDKQPKCPSVDEWTN